MNRKALVVGIDDYPASPLYGCCNDAEEVASLLRKHENGNPNFSVRLEKNVKTRAALREMVRECFSGDADVALFYYSGHGYIDLNGGYLSTPDSSMYDYGVLLTEVLNIANASKCKDKIIILDSCYSGDMGNIATMSQNVSAIAEGVTILTSSRSDELSAEYDGKGLFTSLLVEALDGGAADILGNITPGGIYAYIDKALGPWEQRPVFKTNVNRFTSLRNVIPQVEIDIIRKLYTYFNNENEELLLDPSFERTNTFEIMHNVVKPYADGENVKIFSDLQKLESIGLVVPVDEEHMYYAAMNSKSCKLTSMGKQYWRLLNRDLI